MSDTRVDGFLLIDKPSAWTSHDVVAKVRAVTGQRKVGHAGTLDPMATGLLVLGMGRATRLLRFVQAGVKEYVARVMFGVATDSLDADGAVLSREPMPFGAVDLEQVLARFTGTVLQEPPMVSARKVEGRRLYELAREGEVIAREARPVEIHALALEDFAPSDYPEAVLRILCGSGTYVRTLGDDIARALGGRAHLTALRRTRSGPMSVDDAAGMDVFTDAEAPQWRRLVIPPSEGLGDLHVQEVGPETATAVANGVPITGGALRTELPGLLRIVDESGRLLAVYDSDGSAARAVVVLS